MKRMIISSRSIILILLFTTSIGGCQSDNAPDNQLANIKKPNQNNETASDIQNTVTQQDTKIQNAGIPNTGPSLSRFGKPNKGDKNYSKKVYVDSIIVNIEILNAGESFSTTYGGIIRSKTYDEQVAIKYRATVSLDMSGEFAKDIVKNRFDIHGSYKPCGRYHVEASGASNEVSKGITCYGLTREKDRYFVMASSGFDLNPGNNYTFVEEKYMDAVLLRVVDGVTYTTHSINNAEGRVYSVTKINGREVEEKILLAKYGAD